MFFISSQAVRRFLGWAMLIGLPLALSIVWPLSGAGFTLPRAIAVGLLLTLVLLGMLLADDLHPLRLLFHTWPGRLIVLEFTWIILSTIWSVAPLRSWLGSAERLQGALTGALLFGVFLSAVWIGARQYGRELLVKGILLSNVVLIILAGLELAGVGVLDAWWNSEAQLGRVSSLLGQPNALGIAIVLVLPLVVAKWIQARGIWMWLYAVLFAANTLVAFATASRSAYVAAALGLFLLLVIWRKKLRNRVSAWSPNVQLLVGMLIPIVIALGFAALHERLEHEVTEQRSLQARSIIYRDAMRLIVRRPFGYGLETLELMHQHVRDPKLYEYEPLHAEVDRAHSEPLDLWLTVGPVGLILHYGALAGLLLLAWHQRKKDLVLFAAGVGLFMASVGLLTGFQVFYTLVLYWMLAGLILGGAQREHRPGIALHLRILVFLSAVGVLTITALYAQWVQGRWYMDRAEGFLVGSNFGKAVESSYVSARLFPYDRTILVRSAELNLLLKEQVTDPTIRTEVDTLLAWELSSLQMLTGGYDGMVPLLYSWQAAMSQDVATFQRTSAEAQKLMPADIDTYRIIGHGYELIGDRAGAQRMRKQLERLLPNQWWDLQVKRSRILLKENPWLRELLEIRVDEASTT